MTSAIRVYLRWLLAFPLLPWNLRREELLLVVMALVVVVSVWRVVVALQ